MGAAQTQPQTTTNPLDDLELGLGIWAWGDRLMWGYGGGYREDDVRAAFHTALAAGIRLFDTAEIYGFGKSERLLGQFMRESGQRPLIATKFAPAPWRINPSQLLDALRSSLNRLGVERVDLYQIHWSSPPVGIEAWANALADAVDAGLTAAVGVSNYNAVETRRVYEALARRGIPLASNQVEYSLLERGIERSGVMQTCWELGVRVIAYSPLAMGMLTGKYTPSNPPPWQRRLRFGSMLPRLQTLIGEMRTIGEAHGGKSPAQVALNWTICKGTLPIPGAKTTRQVEQNAGALGWRLTDAEIAALDLASANLTA